MRRNGTVCWAYQNGLIGPEFAMWCIRVMRVREA